MGASLRAVCGGTDLLVKLRAGHAVVPHFLDLTRIEALKGHGRRDGELVFGAACTAEECVRDPWIEEFFPALWRACQWLGGPQMQHVGTLGGNLANASPAADTVPALMVAGAKVTLVNARGRRTVAFEDFLVGPGRTVLAADELVADIRVPLTTFENPDPRPLLNGGAKYRLDVVPEHDPTVAAAEFTTNMFYKAGARLAQVISIACVAAWARVKSGRIEDVRFAYGSAAPTTRRGRTAEDVLRGQALDASAIEAAVEAVNRDISPIDDIRGSAEYKRAICRNFTRAFLRDLAGLPQVGAVSAPREVSPL